MNLILWAGLLVLAFYETYEAYEELHHRTSSRIKRLFVACKALFIWVVTFATICSGIKDEALIAKLSPPQISKEQHDCFVASLSTAPKGAIPIWTISASQETQNYITQIRRMLDDAGYSAGDEGVVEKPGANFSVTHRTGPMETSVFMIFVSADRNDQPVYAGAVQSALKKIGINAVTDILGKSSLSNLKSGQTAICIINAR